MSARAAYAWQELQIPAAQPYVVRTFKLPAPPLESSSLSACDGVAGLVSVAAAMADLREPVQLIPHTLPPSELSICWRRKGESEPQT